MATAASVATVVASVAVASAAVARSAVATLPAAALAGAGDKGILEIIELQGRPVWSTLIYLDLVRFFVAPALILW